MTQYEFIQELEQALQGQVSPQVVEYNVNYYREYIREQLAAGKTQEEVLESLGSPRIIAKTIISAEEARQEEAQNRVHRSSTEDSTYASSQSFHFSLDEILHGKWYYKVIAIAAVLLLLYLVFALIFTAVRILFWPAVIVIVCYAVWNYFMKKRG